MYMYTSILVVPELSAQPRKMIGRPLNNQTPTTLLLKALRGQRQSQNLESCSAGKY